MHDSMIQEAILNFDETLFASISICDTSSEGYLLYIGYIANELIGHF